MSDEKNQNNGGDQSGTQDQGKSKDQAQPGPAPKAFKLEKGADVTFHAVRAGGQVESYPATIIGPSKVANAAKAQLVDLEFSIYGKLVTAGEVKRGAGPTEAPCWSPR